MASEIDEFLAGPIVTWFASCLGRSPGKDPLTYEELIDGVLIYDVFLQMDIGGESDEVTPSLNDPTKRLANLETLLHRVCHFYEEHLGEVIIRRPDPRLVAEQPLELELLLVLLLGCAVKCRNNERFVRGITLLDENTQAAVASYIGQVLHYPGVVLSREMLLPEYNAADDDESYECRLNKAFEAIRKINAERNELIGQLRSAASAHNCESELNEWRAEAIALGEQLDEHKRRMARVESENKRLASEAKSYRDALDDISERAQQTERLEQELSSCKKRLKLASSLQTRYDELKRENSTLKDSKRELIGQLNLHKADARRKIREMEMEIHKLQQRCGELATENEASCKQNSRLHEENADLERRMKLSTSMNATLDGSRISAEADESFNVSLGEQLSQTAQSRALRLELENRRLETLQENSALQSSPRIDNSDEEKNPPAATDRKKSAHLRDLDPREVEETLEELRVIMEDYDNAYATQERKPKHNAPDDSIARELADLKQDFTLLMSEYRREKSKTDELREQLRAKNAKILEYSAQNSKLRGEREILVELKSRAESDKKTLTEYVSQVMRQNRELVARSLESQQRHWDEEKRKNETLNDLQRAKEKLAEKVMYHYRDMSSPRGTPKKRSAAVSAVKNTFVKVRRAGSEFFSVSRWSSADDFAAGSSRTLDNAARTRGFGCKTAPRNNKTIDFLENFSPEDFSFDSKENE